MNRAEEKIYRRKDPYLQALDRELQLQALQEALEALEESRHRYAELYDSAPIGYLDMDDRGCIREINLAGASLLRMERARLRGMPMTMLIAKEQCKLFLDHLHECRLHGKKTVVELQLAAHNNVDVRYVQLLSVPIIAEEGTIQYRSAITDITELRLVEQQLRRMERLHLIGEMAAGIAHEIRNPMTTVRGFLQAFLKKQELAGLVPQLTLMIEELDRANHIMTDYLSLAKERRTHKSSHNLNTVIEELLPTLKRDPVLQGGRIITDLSPQLPLVWIDTAEIQQLILNLARNGMEAMDFGGCLTIGTYTRAERVVLFVRDGGAGIPTALQEKLGTPFVTTKDEGPGLGLAICYNIAHRHEADIQFKTSAAGTTFLVSFHKHWIEKDS